MSKKIRLSLPILCFGLLILSGCSSAVPRQASSEINFLPGTTAYTWPVTLSPNISQTFVFQAHTGQHLFIHRSGNVTIQVLDETDHTVAGPDSQTDPWEVVIPTDGVYKLSVTGNGKGIISAYIPVPVNSWTPDLTSAPIPDHTQRVIISNGASTTASTKLTQGRNDGMVFHALAGQKLQVSASGETTITLLDPGKETVNPSSASLGKWVFNIPATGDYSIVLLGEGVIQLTLSLS